MGLFTSFDINASGLTAQRFRMDTIAENLANQNTTRTAEGGPYVRKVVKFEEKTFSLKDITGQDFTSTLHKAAKKYRGAGVKVTGVYKDNVNDMKMVYDPSHPDADENGYVTYPNVDVVTEMTNLIDASRAYEANATAFEASKALVSRGLSIGQS